MENLRRSWNLIENKGTYGFNRRMLLKTKDLYCVRAEPKGQELEGCPPELRRRFTLGTFFFDLPSGEERETIWGIHLYNMCLPFDVGIHLLPLCLVETVEERLREFKEKRRELVESFLTAYPRLCQEAAGRLRTLYNVLSLATRLTFWFSLPTVVLRAPSSQYRKAKFVGALVLLVVAGGPARPVAQKGLTSFQAFPRVAIWAWENPEDLRTLDPQQYAVAYLDQTIFISDRVFSRPRYQRLLLPAGIRVMAVVRIELSARGADVSSPDLPKAVARLIQRSARKPGVSALQIDFDAARSQRMFYANLLSEVRRTLPAGTLLSITALASWCGADDWIGGLPVDEAVPMFFRMGRNARPSNEPGWVYPIGEALCKGSLGVSTDEAWPVVRPDQRLYVFHPHSWNPVGLENLERLVKP